MDTMHYTEKKKSSKGFVIFFLMFVIIGAAILVLSMTHEKEPVVIGSTESEINRLVDLDKVEKEEIVAKNNAITFKVEEKKHTDNSNSKIKANIVVPSLYIDGEELTELNTKINDKYVSMFEGIKSQLSNAEHKYTYSVSYNVYDNLIDTSRIISIVITEKNVDDASGNSISQKVSTYNIDIATKKEITLTEVAVKYLGKDYKTKIKEKTVSYLVSNNIMKEEEYVYALTGFENFYIKNSNFHIVYNEGELTTNKKYSIIDIEV